MPATILWVEDNPRDVHLLEAAFAEARVPLRLVVAPTAVDAFRYMDRQPPYVDAPRPPDLILVDLNLPALRGQVVLQELRRSTVWRHVPAVVFTSSSNMQELHGCEAMGAAACICKPGSFDGYLAVVLRLQAYLPTRRTSTASGMVPRLAAPGPPPPGT